MATFQSTPLYGGAITVDLPAGFADASNIRQVPDHQEVWLDANGYSSIVFDILEHVEKPSDVEALKYHLEDLVEDTGASTNVLEEGSATAPNTKNLPVHTIHFIQTPAPATNPRHKTPDFVDIHLLLLRLKEQGTDIVITVNVPHYANEYSPASAGETTQLQKNGEIAAKKILETLQIKDWGLFNGS